MKPLGIERQILLIVLIPILLMAVLLEYYMVYSRFSDLEQALLGRSQLLAHQLASTSEYAIFSGNTTTLRQNVDAALAHRDMDRVLMLDAYGKPLINEASSKDGHQLKNLLDKANGANPLYQDDDSLILYQPIIASQVRLDELDYESGLAPAPIPGKQLGAVIIEVSKQRLIKKKHEILLFSLAFTLLIFLAALQLSLWTTRGITRPVKGMSEAMGSFGAGKLGTRIMPQPKVRELSELAKGFNQMAGQIQHNQAQLETAVKERTAKLAASETELRTLIENSPTTIVRYDRNLRRIYVNSALSDLFKDGKNSLLGKKPSEFPGGPESAFLEARIRKVFLTGSDMHFEMQWQRNGIKEGYRDIRLKAERDSSGNIISVLAVGSDITELNESREELRRKELAKSRFLAAAGHDLRQPLAAANLFIDALKLTELSPAQDKVVQKLDQSMSNFNELLEALLNISRLDAGAVKPENSAIHLSAIRDWLEQNFVQVARNKQLDFKLRFPERAALVIYSDIDLIKSVLMNLVSNAIKYTSSGAVLVSARQRSHDVLFQVWDTGIGISDEQIGHIFDEFYQVNNPQRDRSRGLGLGLAIVKRAITLLGGNINCRSRPNHGSVFEFRLPLDSAMSEFAPRSAAGPTTRSNNLATEAVRGKHFVVVEDDTLVSEAIHGTLTMMGGKVQCFPNADEALLAPDIEHADYYIADYMMEGTLTGIQFLNRLRELLNKPIKAVVMTGDTSPAFIQDMGDYAWPVLHKPVNISQLISSLDIQNQKPVC